MAYRTCGSRKSDPCNLLEKDFKDRGISTEVLASDLVHSHLSRGLGFANVDRDEIERRLGFVSDLLSRNGVATIVAAIAP